MRKLALITFLLLTGAAAAQDMPLSQVLIDGEHDLRLRTVALNNGGTWLEIGERTVQRLETDAGVALCQHVRTQRHRRAHDGDRERLADAGGVTAEQIDL